MNNQTLEYYRDNAMRFAAETGNVDFHETQDRFLKLLPLNALILDFGCGSGRDSKYFAQLGYRVVATDGSPEMCQIAARTCGLPVRQMLFTELDAVDTYDGIWACASILHLPKSELTDVFQRLARALKPNGWLYTSFKYGTFEGMRNGRWYTDFTEESYICDILSVKECWVSNDVRPERSHEQWLNLILKNSRG